MRARSLVWLFLVLPGIPPAVSGAPSAPGVAAKEDPQSGGVKTERISTEIELAIEQVTPLARYAGTALVSSVDPRYVLVGKVVWVQRPEVLAQKSRQAFAIHSPTQLGLGGWQRGDTICLLLTRIRSEGRTQWELGAMKPDAGCRGGG